VNAKLLQLASPALPVGGYSYSQGLEAAIEAGTVRDAASAARWIGDVLELAVRNLEAPLFLPGAASLHIEQTFLVSARATEPIVEQPRDRPIVLGGRA